MKKFFITTIAAIAALSLNSCTSVQGEPYTSDMCLVTDNELGSMGDPVSMVYQGKEVKFCCSPCIRKFNKNPEKYMQRRKELMAK